MISNYTELMDLKHIKISHQRIRIMEYLENNLCHPNADMILKDMKKEMPTLSKSTVYKTLNAFVKANILREITIDGNEIRYEHNLEDHGHFKCNKCSNLYDFDCSFDIEGINELEGFCIEEKNVYLKGICKKCIEQGNKPFTEG